MLGGGGGPRTFSPSITQCRAAGAVRPLDDIWLGKPNRHARFLSCVFWIFAQTQRTWLPPVAADIYIDLSDFESDDGFCDSDEDADADADDDAGMAVKADSDVDGGCSTCVYSVVAKRRRSQPCPVDSCRTPCRPSGGYGSGEGSGGSFHGGAERNARGGGGCGGSAGVTYTTTDAALAAAESALPRLPGQAGPLPLPASLPGATPAESSPAGLGACALAGRVGHDTQLPCSTFGFGGPMFM